MVPDSAEKGLNRLTMVQDMLKREFRQALYVPGRVPGRPCVVPHGVQWLQTALVRKA